MISSIRRIRFLCLSAFFAIAFGMVDGAFADASRRVIVYFDVGEGFIYLTEHCKADGLHPCNCAVASREIAPSLKDEVLCWREDGDRITFTNHKYRFEARQIDLKVLITEPSVPSEPRSEPVVPEATSCDEDRSCS
jgi:hypothetical protein